MRFALSEDQVSLRTMVRDYLRRRVDATELHRSIEPGAAYNTDIWTEMAEGLGLHGIAIPEEFDGSGATLVELAIVLQEMGRVLLASPFFASVVLAATTLQQSGDEGAQKEWLPGIASGELIGTLAYAEHARGGAGTRHINVCATSRAEGWTITGTKRFVVDGDSAGLLLVTAKTESGVSIFAVDAAANGVTVKAPLVLDPTRHLANITFEDAPARLVGQEGEGQAILERTLAVAGIALSAEMVGAAENSLEMAVEYAGARVQFDRPIGSFQAIKHKSADMFIDVETSRTALLYAAWSLASGADDAQLVAGLTLAHISDASFRTGAQLLQILGGIGYTWEHDAHLYFKRMKTSGQLLGSADEYREGVARAIGL